MKLAKVRCVRIRSVGFILLPVQSARIKCTDSRVPQDSQSSQEQEDDPHGQDSGGHSVISLLMSLKLKTR
jgi:hypothetical protein